MELVLLLDVGNTACKWRLMGQKEPAGRIAHHKNWPLLAKALPSMLPKAICLASVAGAQANATIAKLLADKYQITPVIYQAEAQTLGVTNAYQQAGRLGVDRWLGIVEAYLQYGAAIVVDFGSALTIDVVDATGMHQGGYIVPGLSLLRKSLSTDTADVLFETQAANSLALGKNTQDAVEQGLLRMIKAFVMDVMVAHQQKLDNTYTLVTTGGDAGYITSLLETDIDIKHHSELVLDGLQSVVLSNKNMSG